MLSNVKLEDLYSLDIIERSFTNVNDLIFPLKVHVKDISHSYEDDEFYQVAFVDNRDEYIYEIDETNENPYQKEQNLFELKKRVKFIYKFIDKDIRNEDNKTVLSLINADTEEGFVNFVINEPLFSVDSIIKIEYEIRFHIGRVKNRFMKKAIDIFQLNEELPNIKLEDENQTPTNWAKHMSYNICMLSLQSVSELPMTIWFPENINKAYMEWSWREMEMKRLYITAKTRTENFRELVKAKQFESKMAKNKNKKSR